MSTKNKVNNITIDFDIGIGELIPATQEAFRGDGFLVGVRREEKTGLALFKKSFSEKIENNLRNENLFPTEDEVFVVIIQYFASQKEYFRRDIDNLAKTILDVLKDRLYRDDSQVRTLLVSKKMEKRVTQNFAYIAIKKLNSKQEVDALKISGLERSVTMFQELKAKGIL